MWWKKREQPSKPSVVMFPVNSRYRIYKADSWKGQGRWISEERVRSFADALLTSGLEWYWTSHYGKPFDGIPPDARPQSLKKLDASNIPDLVYNASYEDPDSGMEIRMYALESPNEGPVDEAHLYEMVRCFASGEPSPLKAMIHRLEDTAALYVYVPWTPAAAICNLLARFGASPDTAERRRLTGSNLLRLESAYGFKGELADKARFYV